MLDPSGLTIMARGLQRMGLPPEVVELVLRTQAQAAACESEATRLRLEMESDLTYHQIEFAKGYFIDAPVAIASGIGQVVAHPLQTLWGFGSAMAQPYLTAQAIYSDYRTRLSTSRGQGSALGEVAFGVLTGSATAKAIDELGDLAKASRLWKQVQTAAPAARGHIIPEGRLRQHLPERRRPHRRFAG